MSNNEQDQQKNIRRVALNLLARRDHSQLELFQKLKLKGHSANEIHTVIAQLVERGFINESRFAENYIHWRRNRGYGPHRIQIELEARGIPAEVIAEHLQITDNAWLAEVRKVWQKQFKGSQPADYKSQAKQMRFLQYRGFTREQIESVFNKEF